jgi:hypothetical protein
MARKPKTTTHLLDIPPPPEMAAEAPLYIDPPTAKTPPHPPFFSRGLLLSGMVVACVVGAGAGLWARPAIGERKWPGFIKKAEGQLQIVVGEAPPAPIGPPLEVMRADTPVYLSPAPLAPPTPVAVAEPVPEPPPLAEPAMRVPAPSSAGPLRVTVIEPKPVKVEKKAEPAPKAVAKLKVDKVAAVATKKPLAKGPELKKVDLKAAKAKAKLIDEPKLMKTKGKAAKAPEPKLTRVKAEAEKPAKLIKAKLSDTKAKPTRPTKPAAGTKATKATKPTPATRPTKPVPQTRAKAEPKPSLDFGKLLASLKTRTEPAKVEKAVLKAPTPPPAAARPEPAPEPAPPPRPAPVQQAARDRCDASDPGEVLVCQNPSLQMADRRLQRAYRAAEDAGVEPWRLQQQQRRWLAARTAAARENPWAVRDVYAARIAELEDLSRGRGGY